jgi:putative transposase
MIGEASVLSEEVGISAACQAYGIPRSSFYEAQKPSQRSSSAFSPPRALSQEEKDEVRQVLNSERFQDQAPREVYAALLDEGEYYCHWRTMYRILDEHEEVRERRDQLRHPSYQRPELLATGVNQVWSWDVTKLLGPEKWTYYYLYVILDIYSRYVPGWLVADQQTAKLARVLVAETCEKQDIPKGQLTLHADRGGPMIAKTLAHLLADLGVGKSHSRPYNADDNPYSEAQFRTLKYRPDYPKRFESQPAARQWARGFFDWYNNQHYHSGIGLLTPADVHYGRAEKILQERQKVLQKAYQKNPERFVHGPSKPPQLPKAVWINPPQESPPEVDTDQPRKPG